MGVNLSLYAGAGWQFFDDTGNPLAGGKIYSYAAGTTTPQATYTSEAGNVAHSNPIVLDAAGRVPAGGEVWVTEGLSYKFVLETAAAVTIGTYDNINGTYVAQDLANSSNPALGDALVGFRQSNGSGNLTGSVGKTVHVKLQEMVSVLDFGADPTGVASSSTAIANAISSGASQIYFPPGTYSCTINLSVNGVKLVGSGRDIYNTGKGTLLINNSVNSPLITVTGQNVLISDMYLDNNLLPSDTILLQGSTYSVVERISIKNHGNASTKKYAVNMDGATISALTDIAIRDNDQLFGGALTVSTSYYCTVTNFSSGRSGTNNNQWAMECDGLAGAVFTNLYLEEGGGNGLITLNSCNGSTFYSFSSELFASRLPVLPDPAFIRMNSCNNIQWFGGYISHQTAPSTTVVPIFFAGNSNGVTIDGMYINRSVNSTNTLVLGTVSSYNVTLTNLTTRNVVAIGNSTAVACNICNITSGENVYIDNIYARTANQKILVSDMANMQIGNAPNVEVINGSVNATVNTFAPAFLAYSDPQANVTGDGTAVTISFSNVVFDTNSNYNPVTSIFTAPTRGRYQINVLVYLLGLTNTHTFGEMILYTSNRNYGIATCNPWNMSYQVSGELRLNGSILADMDAGDTAYLALTVAGGSKVVDVATNSYFSANLYK